MVRTTVVVGIGMWTFDREVWLPACPRVGDYVGSAHGEGYSVSVVSITPERVHVRCVVRFTGQKECDAAAEAWDAGMKEEL
ncbi:MAG: hypothetical protein E6R03_00130 [Hyphomicrobiaceae bacterium]|nr:MAG: hypothetical protein E6R03_00130 [Hyphomicrobiaceae bacterium]